MTKSTYHNQTSLPLLSAFPRFILILLCLPICLLGSACQSLVGREFAHPEEPNWPEYADQSAQRYLDRCQRSWAQARQTFAQLEQSTERAPIDTLMAINDLERQISEPTGRAALYANVHPNESMRAAGDICAQHFKALTSDIYLSRLLYDKLSYLTPDTLPETQRYYAQHTLQMFKRAGVGLAEHQRARVRQLNAEIVKLGQTFLANIRNDNRQVELTMADLEGLPSDYLATRQPNAQGAIVISTQSPDYLPFMRYAVSDEAKRRLYLAFRQRGYPANKEVLQQLLSARYELARLLGFSHFADYIIADKMMESADQAQAFIEQVATLAKPQADRDYATLLRRLQQIDPDATRVDDWQKVYLENLIVREHYAVAPQQVRPYFSYAKVKTGLFQLVEGLFAVQIIPWQTNVWHPSVEAYEIRENGQLLGQFYLDMHPRPGKYQHAAQFGIRDGVQDLQTPIVALVCNFPGGEGGSDLLEHSQVETLFHEFGHLLHSIFGGHQPWARFAGTNTQRDFVEVPSQILEEWAWDTTSLQAFALNANDQSIPAALVEKMNRARNFGKGLFVRHQMFYAALSLHYHNRDPQKVDLDQLMMALQAQFSPFPYVDETYLYANFGHLHNYSALYYTYIWSQVIAADMFAEFKREGLNNRELAARYRYQVLAPGGSRPAAQLVENFLGRPFNFEAVADSLSGEAQP